MRKLLVSAALLATTLLVTNCEAAKEAAEKAVGDMTIKGTVSRANSGDAIEGATVRAIQLLDAEAIKSLVRYEKIPDGAGSTKDQIRIDLTKVHAYPADKETTTDADGKFTLDVPTNVYLVYTFGPGDAPGGAAAYSVHFWGINPESGELDLDHLIGRNGLTEQVNDKIELSGGPVAPAGATIPDAPALPDAPAAATTPAAIAEEPATASAETPEDIVAPTPSTTFWKSIDLYKSDASVLGTGTGVYVSEDEIQPVEGERYMMLRAELNAAQSEPVYLVIQTGFDSRTVTDCDDTQSTPQAHVYPVTANGTLVEYKFVPPGKYYKLFFAKSASQADGQPVVATEATEALRIGERTCEDAVPARPFLATLTWDRESDVDLHVFKYDAEKVAADNIAEALVDQANWTRREGDSLSLDVDNTYAYGPENNGEAATVTDSDKYCYVVQVHLYSRYGEEPVVPTVHVMHVTKADGKTTLNQYEWSESLTEYGQWKSVGIYGPSGCAKLAASTTAP